MSVSSVVEKVQKLLALSKSNNANEAAAAAAAANRLMDQYRLSEADLEVEGQVMEPLEEDQGYIYETGKVTRWKMHMIMNLVAHYGLAVWNDNHFPDGRQITRYRLVGRKSDITITKYMFAWLSSECTRLATLQGKGRGRVWIASWCDGFVSGVNAQLRASRNEVAASASNAAMVKINARSEEASAFMRQLHTNLRKRGSSSQHQTDYRAFGEGLERGKNLHLGQHLGAGGVKLLGS